MESAPRIVLLAVDLQNHPHSVRKQHEEVHTKPQQRVLASFLYRLRVPVQPHLGQERRQTGNRVLEMLEVRLE